MSDEAILAAGTLVEFSTNLETPVYKELMGAMSLGSVGYMAEAKEKTTLRDTEKKYGAGIKDAPDKSIKGQHYALNTDQQEFLDAAEATQTVLVRIPTLLLKVQQLVQLLKWNLHYLALSWMMLLAKIG